MEKIPYINTSIYFDDSFSSLFKYIDLDSSNVFLIVDSNIYDLYSKKFNEFENILVVESVEDSKSFSRNFKVRDILITTTDGEFLLNKELENDNTSQWIDVNTTTSYLKIDILSAYPGIEVSGSQPFEECAIQEITFYGRG